MHAIQVIYDGRVTFMCFGMQFYVCFFRFTLSRYNWSLEFILCLNFTIIYLLLLIFLLIYGTHWLFKFHFPSIAWVLLLLLIILILLHELHSVNPLMSLRVHSFLLLVALWYFSCCFWLAFIIFIWVESLDVIFCFLLVLAYLSDSNLALLWSCVFYHRWDWSLLRLDYADPRLKVIIRLLLTLVISMNLIAYVSLAAS